MWPPPDLKGHTRGPFEPAGLQKIFVQRLFFIGPQTGAIEMSSWRKEATVESVVGLFARQNTFSLRVLMIFCSFASFVENEAILMEI